MKWKGYSSDDNSWEPEAGLNQAAKDAKVVFPGDPPARHHAVRNFCGKSKVVLLEQQAELYSQLQEAIAADPPVSKHNLDRLRESYNAISQKIADIGTPAFYAKFPNTPSTNLPLEDLPWELPHLGQFRSAQLQDSKNRGYLLRESREEPDVLPEEKVGAYYVVCRAAHVVQAAPSPQGRCLNLRRWTAGPRTKLETISNLDTTKYGFLKVSDAESAAPALNHLVLAAENPDSTPLTANRFPRKRSLSVQTNITT